MAAPALYRGHRESISMQNLSSVLDVQGFFLFDYPYQHMFIPDYLLM